MVRAVDSDDAASLCSHIGLDFAKLTADNIDEQEWLLSKAADDIEKKTPGRFEYEHIAGHGCETYGIITTNSGLANISHES